ncbi:MULTISPECIES: hypothetical protein [Pseudomonas]|uniref:hypothetical protein n=1 Tax=Pseudomonas TaxID=286 RepID=UPI000C0BA322|nr:MULTISPECIES: hypothetical protein [Pseudomonas]PHN61160.1 hypothetical protein AO268_03485 [Pseudomonas sp. ICMP 8385]
MASSWLVLTIVAAYRVVLALISFWVRRSTQSAKNFTSGGKEFPTVIPSLQAFAQFFGHMHEWMAGIAVAGLAGALFGTMAALTMGIATLLLKDFYQPFFNPPPGDRACHQNNNDEVRPCSL